MARALALLLTLSAAAGCVATDAGEPTPDAAAGASLDAASPGFAQAHDHDDPLAHAFGSGMTPIGYHALAADADASRAGDATARGNWGNSEIIVRGAHAYVGYLASPWRFAIVDVSEPATPTLVSAFETSGAWTMDLDVSSDGDWVFVSVTHEAVGTVFATDYLAQAASAPTGVAGPGVMVVDARDRANPKLSSFMPIHGLGPHTAVHHEYPDGREVVFADKAEGTVPGNGIVVLDVVDTPAGNRVLQPLAFIPIGADGADFPHDVDVQLHPLTNRTLLYVASYYTGLRIYDVTDPTAPEAIATFADYPTGEDVAIHDVHPAPALIGGKHYTLTAPELLAHPDTGRLRVYDTTDPAAPTLVGSWKMPGEYVVDEQLLFSPHNFVFLADGRVALAHGHAGVWIIDWASCPSAPTADAFFVPSVEGAVRPTWSPLPGAPWMWGTAVDEAGNLFASDVHSGLHALRIDAAPETLKSCAPE